MWSAGVILYLLLGRFPPFYDEEPDKTIKKIIEAKPEFKGI